MIQVQIEVESGASRLRVSARASSIERALELVGESYPGSKVRVAPAPEHVRPSGWAAPRTTAGRLRA